MTIAYLEELICICLSPFQDLVVMELPAKYVAVANVKVNKVAGHLMSSNIETGTKCQTGECRPCNLCRGFDVIDE